MSDTQSNAVLVDIGDRIFCKSLNMFLSVVGVQDGCVVCALPQQLRHTHNACMCLGSAVQREASAVSIKLQWDDLVDLVEKER